MTTKDQIEALEAYLTPFCYPAHKDIRTRVIDALWRTNDAIRDGRPSVIEMVNSQNEALLQECQNTHVGSEIIREVNTAA